MGNTTCASQALVHQQCRWSSTHQVPRILPATPTHHTASVVPTVILSVHTNTEAFQMKPVTANSPFPPSTRAFKDAQFNYVSKHTHSLIPEIYHYHSSMYSWSYVVFCQPPSSLPLLQKKTLSKYARSSDDTTEDSGMWPLKMLWTKGTTVSYISLSATVLIPTHPLQYPPCQVSCIPWHILQSTQMCSCARNILPLHVSRCSWWRRGLSTSGRYRW